MPYPNVWVTIADPDSLYAGTFPGVGMAVRKIHLAAFASRQDAEDGISPTALVAWTLVRTTDTPPAEHYGPFRYGYFDSSSSPSRWYAYRFESDTNDFGPWSQPWRAQHQRTTLLQLLSELPMLFGDLLHVEQATAATTTTITIPGLSDPGTSQDYFLHWHLAVPVNGEFAFARIASYSGGTATVTPSFPSAPPAGSTVILTPLAPVRQLIQAVNIATEEMEGETEISIPANEPVLCPDGLTPSSFQRAFAVWPGQNRETPTRVTFGGNPMAVMGLAPSWASSIQVVYHAPYSMIDGPMLRPDDTTSAPLPWARASAAAAFARMVLEQDPEDKMAQALFQRLAARAKEQAGRWAPERRAQVAAIQSRGGLPGPIARW